MKSLSADYSDEMKASNEYFPQFGAVSYIVRGVSKSAFCQAHKIFAVKTKLFKNNGLPWLTDVPFCLNWKKNHTVKNLTMKPVGIFFKP